MNILLINPEYPPVGGGAGNASAYIARELARLGHRVQLITARWGHLSPQEEQEGVTIWRIPAGRRYQDRSNAWEQVMFILSGYRAAARLVRGWRPDVVLAFFGVPSGAIALGLKLRFNLPYVVSMRGGDVPGARPGALYIKVVSPLLHQVWRRAEALVANSQGLKALAQPFEPNLPIAVIPNGVDVSRFPPGERSWTPPHLLFVGRLVRLKALDVLFRALERLRSLDWQLTLVGDGPERVALEELAQQLGLAARVHFVGWQPKEKLAEFYAAATIFVLPSRHEGMSNAVLEAMASGLPVIASRIAGNEEMVVPGETGDLFSVDDLDELTAALGKLLSDPERCQAMGRAARRRAETVYTWEQVAQQYSDLLQQSRGR